MMRVKGTEKVWNKTLHSKPVKWFIAFTQKRPFPGNPHISWYSVLEFYVRWVDLKDLQLRATSLSFTFFLALFPSIIFLFTIIAYLPVTNSHNQILAFIEQLLPVSAYKAVRSTLFDILKNQRSGLLSFGFLAAMYFSTNGFVSLMNALNRSGKQKETRSYWKKRLVALLLALVVSVLLLAAVGLMTIGNFSIKYLNQLAYFPSKITPVLLLLLNLVVVAGLILLFVSLIYYLAPNHKNRWRFISPGSVIACVSIMITTIGFSSYINYFNAYNKVYGSIGVLIVIMLLIYINTYILLLCYEFNIAVDKTIEEIKQFKTVKSNRVVMLRKLKDQWVE
ncbi:MAG: YihY/virulence factor BrkB family protein [Bacteroidia bacterium]|jgi:membrane protein|nr:YihY/virulence factor BrkB family protein [Bacteroidia bacterium]